MISTADIESLIPDFLMESGHFYLVVTDIDGKIVKSNRNFQRVGFDPIGCPFSDFLDSGSDTDFCYSLDLMLGAPKIRRHLLLEHPPMKDGSSQIWWEFSVITTPDMDISGVLGIGVGIQFLEQEMPWNSLVDVLGFGKVTLDSSYRIQTWDSKVSKWFGYGPEKSRGVFLPFIPAFSGLVSNPVFFEMLEKKSKPACFLIPSLGQGQQPFAALLAPYSEGFHLFLSPKDQPEAPKLESDKVQELSTSSLPGAIWILGKAGKILFQNEEGKELSRIWNGTPFLVGQSLSFSKQSSRFAPLLHAIDSAKKSIPTDLEISYFLPDQVLGWWKACVRSIRKSQEDSEIILIQVWDLTSLNAKTHSLRMENERLRELALSPSHILRGPLSSIMGIIELIDANQLDTSNRRLFDHLKPLTLELDNHIRLHAKKVSQFD